MKTTSTLMVMIIYGDNNNHVDTVKNSCHDLSLLMIIRNCQDADLAQVPRRCFAAAADAACPMVQRWKPPVAEKYCHTP